jgi:hypothetical protein
VRALAVRRHADDAVVDVGPATARFLARAVPASRHRARPAVTVRDEAEPAAAVIDFVAGGLLDQMPPRGRPSAHDGAPTK